MKSSRLTVKYLRTKVSGSIMEKEKAYLNLTGHVRISYRYIATFDMPCI
ncbi:hypothetical protein PIECOFPK_00232 [Mycovorax composti]|jgi:hypothetical protein|uniref:Uncharacterized protein n=1 Tax=Mycovorax composti TaxID=2962693 RepID=A0ABZ2EGK0_9BACT